MENLSLPRITWMNFLLIAAAMLGFYFLLRWISNWWPGVAAGQGFRGRIKQAVHYFLLGYEVLMILILGNAFFLIDPLLHGLLLLLFFLGSFTHVKNYISGRVVRFDKDIEPGVRLQVGQVRGIVGKLGNLGLYLKTSEGVVFLTYSTLLSEGYTLISADEMGGLYHLRITPLERENTDHFSALQLLDLLTTAPYIDGTQKPEMIPVENEKERLETRVLLREENHLYELTQLMREWGYNCRVVGGN